MEKPHFELLEVVIHRDGVVRLYGKGGLIFEASGDYVRTVTYLDPKYVAPSGVGPVKNADSAITKEQK